MNDAPYVTFDILAAAVHRPLGLVLLGTDTGRVILVKIGDSGNQLRNYFGAEQGAELCKLLRGGWQRSVTFMHFLILFVQEKCA